MKNNLENQDIKTDKPLAMSYEALKAERDALERQLSMSEAKCKGYFSDAAAALVRCDALAVENAALNNFCKNAAFDADYESELCMERGGFTDVFNNIETPATSAALAAIEARVWAEAKDFAKSMLVTDSADHIDFLFDGKIQQLKEAK
ncbi:hypothetical protein [Serratia marcescens]|uniref:hypothetical protein n=1 Tax=Serratia marcescens TaxID=615 RepID=UPI002FDB08E7